MIFGHTFAHLVDLNAAHMIDDALDAPHHDSNIAIQRMCWYDGRACAHLRSESTSRRHIYGCNVDVCVLSSNCVSLISLQQTIVSSGTFVTLRRHHMISCI